MPKILTSYTEVWWPHPEMDYEEEHGWVDEEGSEIESDADADESLVDMAVRFLRADGATEPSSTSFHSGIWYSWPSADQDYQTGRHRTESCHLEDFTPEQERAIWLKLTTGKIGYMP